MNLPQFTCCIATTFFLAATLASESVAQMSGGLSAQAYDLCARGINNDPAKPFTQTLRVKLSLNGASLDDSVRKSVLAQLIRATMWNNRASDVFVEDYDVDECAASAGNESEINLKFLHKKAEFSQ